MKLILSEKVQNCFPRGSSGFSCKNFYGLSLRKWGGFSTRENLNFLNKFKASGLNFPNQTLAFPSIHNRFFFCQQHRTPAQLTFLSNPALAVLERVIRKDVLAIHPSRIVLMLCQIKFLK